MLCQLIKHTPPRICWIHDSYTNRYNARGIIVTSCIPSVWIWIGSINTTYRYNAIWKLWPIRNIRFDIYFFYISTWSAICTWVIIWDPFIIYCSCSVFPTIATWYHFIRFWFLTQGVIRIIAEWGINSYYDLGHNLKYIEAISVFIIATNYNGNPYNVFVNRQIYDPNGLGDQHLLSASGYYSSGWHVSLTVSDKATYRTHNSGYLIDGGWESNANYIAIAAF